ncbi:hypothetical protein AB5I41_06780 [Sphingomonas sp. MMS24-JH45]
MPRWGSGARRRRHTSPRSTRSPNSRPRRVARSIPERDVDVRAGLGDRHRRRIHHQATRRHADGRPRVGGPAAPVPSLCGRGTAGRQGTRGPPRLRRGARQRPDLAGRRQAGRIVACPGSAGRRGDQRLCHLAGDDPRHRHPAGLLRRAGRGDGGAAGPVAAGCGRACSPRATSTSRCSNWPWAQ